MTSMPRTLEIHNVKVLSAGWSTLTDRFYPKDALSNLLPSFRRGPGELHLFGDSTSLQVNLSLVSHFANRLFLKEDGCELWSEIQFLDTPNGRIAKDMFKRKKIRFDCAMLGKVNRFSEVEPESVSFVKINAYAL